MIEKRGIGVFPGIVTGKAAVFRHTVLDNVEHSLSNDSDRELSEFEAAHKSVLEEVRAIKPSSKEERDMLSVYESMLLDPDFLSLIRENIKVPGLSKLQQRSIRRLLPH